MTMNRRALGGLTALVMVAGAFGLSGCGQVDVNTPEGLEKAIKSRQKLEKAIPKVSSMLARPDEMKPLIPALVDLGVFTPDLRIVKAKYDKYKQINRFIELVDDAFRASEQQEITILDFGCGKSYLTFILYYYFTVKRGVKATILGYDLKEDVVEHCNAIAQKYGYDGLRFVVSDVTRDTLADTHVDMVVTLHACDTATDYALWYAVEKGVKHIFSVPCCQHEINATIHKGGDFDVLLRHGLLQERFSALLTDSIRAAVLEDMGYTVDVIEFIDFAHSPKNLMLRCVKDRRAGERNLSAAWELAEKYGFRQTLLELAEKKRLSAQNTAP